MEALAALTVGQRNDRLMALRERVFGSRLDCLASCPECGEKLELAFDLADIRAAASSAASEDEASEEQTTQGHSLTVSEYDLRFRLPNSVDLMAISEGSDPAHGSTDLMGRCLMTAALGGGEIGASELPREVVEALETRMAEIDPCADVLIALACLSCRHRWQLSFDISTFFWGEVNAWAQRQLEEVHVLARYYGWSETEILAMGSGRRQAYLGRISE